MGMGNVMLLVDPEPARLSATPSRIPDGVSIERLAGVDGPERRGRIERDRRGPARRIRSGSGAATGDRGRDRRVARPSVVHPLPHPGRRRARRGRPARDVRGRHLPVVDRDRRLGARSRPRARSSRGWPRPMGSPTAARSSTSGSSPTTRTRSASTSDPGSSRWGRPVPTCSSGDGHRRTGSDPGRRWRQLPASRPDRAGLGDGRARSSGRRSGRGAGAHRRRVPAGPGFDRPRRAVSRGRRRPARRHADSRSSSRGPRAGWRLRSRATAKARPRPGRGRRTLPRRRPASVRDQGRSVRSASSPAGHPRVRFLLLIEGEPGTIHT